MMEIGKPKLTEIAGVDESQASFVVEPLERGYGNTIGNALRRILCTALPGAAIIGVEIEGVRHRCHTMHHASIGNRAIKITADEVARFKEHRQVFYTTTILPFVARINTFVPELPISDSRSRILHFPVSPSSIINSAKIPVKTSLILLDRHLQVKKSDNLKL